MIEETIVKHAKSRGGSGGSAAGLTGLQTNYGAYQRWVLSSSERAKFLQATYRLADMSDEQHIGNQHRDVRSAEKRRSERQVSRAVEAISNFNNPFTIPNKDLVYCMSSGAPASAAVEKDILRTESAGRQAKEDFIANRLAVGENFF